jgi:hypothetical protein
MLVAMVPLPPPLIKVTVQVRGLREKTSIVLTNDPESLETTSTSVAFFRTKVPPSIFLLISCTETPRNVTVP